MSTPVHTPFESPTGIVVVGGGSAGCVVPARLSEDPDRTVLRPDYYWPGLTATTASRSR